MKGTVQFPLGMVFRRGAVFRDGLYSRLDDPAYAGKTKPKYMVMLSKSPQDDPILYILTTSEKERHSDGQHLIALEAGAYDFLLAPVPTYLELATVETNDISREEFSGLYETGQIECVGHLDDVDVQRLMKGIRDCPVLTRGLKRRLGLEA